MAVKYKDLQQFKYAVASAMDTKQADDFYESCLKELAARLLQKVIKRTPVGQYPNENKVGGTLRRGWTAKTHDEATNKKNVAVQEHLNRLEISKNNGIYTIKVINPVEYAEYVEYGHRTRGGNGWVEGQLMLTISENEINANKEAILEAKLEKWLKEHLL